VERAVRFR